MVDLGCGEGKLEILLKKHKIVEEVFSYDIVSTAEHVIPKDIRNLDTHEDGSVDIAVFCLSLMGTNWLEFVKEASRVLKVDGYLLVSEVTSRIMSDVAFLKIFEILGFKKIYFVRFFYSFFL